MSELTDKPSLGKDSSDLTLVIRQKEWENLLGKFEGNIK